MGITHRSVLNGVLFYHIRRDFSTVFCPLSLLFSRAFPLASYDEISGSFSGKLAGNINSAFKSTNIALERDLKYFRVGQIPGDNSWLIYARAELDIKIVVWLKQVQNNEVEVVIDYGSGNLMKSQQIFNAIAKNMNMFEGR